MSVVKKLTHIVFGMGVMSLIAHMEAQDGIIGGILRIVTINRIQFAERKNTSIPVLAMNTERMFQLLQNTKLIFHRCGLTQ